MKWWLIIYALSPDGLTAFDLEYSSRGDCTAAQVQTYAINRERTEPRKLTLDCSPHPMPVRFYEEPEVQL